MDLTVDERRQITATFGCSNSDLDKEINKYTNAAAEEYIRMILGQHVFTRGQDIREYRLYLLIRHVFGGRLPTEQKISSLFQTTTTQSRALLRAVMSKYQYELQEAIHDTLREELGRAQPDPNTEGAYLITVDSENVIQALNRKIASIDGTLPQITKARNTVSTYEIAKSSYSKLAAILR
jgi:hypothetical protein